jgi:hypothetical protein
MMEEVSPSETSVHFKETYTALYPRRLPSSASLLLILIFKQDFKCVTLIGQSIYRVCT